MKLGPDRFQVEAANGIADPQARSPAGSCQPAVLGLAAPLCGGYQIGVLSASNPGSGKVLLPKMITTLHGGAQRGETAARCCRAAEVDHGCVEGARPHES